MTWSYSGNPINSELDKYRFLIGDTDTDTNNQLMSDEEINFVLSTNASHNKRLYVLYETIANLFSKDTVKTSLSQTSEDGTERLKYYTSKAAEYKKLCSYSGIPSSKPLSPKVFKKGMHNNV